MDFMYAESPNDTMADYYAGQNDAEPESDICEWCDEWVDEKSEPTWISAGGLSHLRCVPASELRGADA